MIRYRLKCSEGHGFDAWFRSSDDCERQISAGLVNCSICGDIDVQKALMAPPVQTARTRTAAPVEQVVETPSAKSPPPVPVAKPIPEKNQTPDSEDMALFVAMMRKVREKVVKSADYVGPRFAEEARRIHFGETKERGIYGEATPDEVNALQDDGVDIMPLPVLPEDQN